MEWYFTTKDWLIPATTRSPYVSVKPAISEYPSCNTLILAPEGMGLLQALKAGILVIYGCVHGGEDVSKNQLDYNMATAISCHQCYA